MQCLGVEGFLIDGVFGHGPGLAGLEQVIEAGELDHGHIRVAVFAVPAAAHGFGSWLKNGNSDGATLLVPIQWPR